MDDVVEIRGVGFGSSRIWPFPHAPDGPPRGRPRELSGPPGPFQNLVYFPEGNGGAVAASEYLPVILSRDVFDFLSRTHLRDRTHIFVPRLVKEEVQRLVG